MLDHSCQVQRHPQKERGHDCYDTPPEAVEALLRAESLPHDIWEPACGKGNIVNVLRAAGHRVWATDLVYRGCPGATPAPIDFLTHQALPPSEAIVTNPPFYLAQQFVEHALTQAPLVVMLLRLAFMESERRKNILENAGLARVHVFAKRLPMMHREGWAGKKGNSGMAFAWFVWERDYKGPTTIDRISW